jgi:hypothetical protein
VWKRRVVVEIMEGKKKREKMRRKNRKRKRKGK